ncbi:MAG: NUDIX domain-containing protein [Polyangiaceae bacterium]
MNSLLESPRPSLGANVALFSLGKEDLEVLLVRPKGRPWKNTWVLPGGDVRRDEPLDRAALRGLEQATGLDGVSLEQLGAYGEPGRDPRGHAVTVAYFSFTVAETRPFVPADDVAEIRWHALRSLDLDYEPHRARRVVSSGARTRLGLDHALIIEHARMRLQERLLRPTRWSSFELVPSRFTLTELQRVHEAVFGRSLDKRNFRSSLLARGIVEPVGASRRLGPRRPTQLYTWAQASGQ